MADSRVYRRQCRKCRTTFETTAGQRIKCYDCSPAQGRGSEVIRIRPDVPEPVKTSADEEPTGELESRIRDQLDTMGLLESWRAELALGLARDLDRPGVTGAPRTSMTKQLYGLMMDFEGETPPKDDALDDLMGDAERLRGLS